MHKNRILLSVFFAVAAWLIFTLLKPAPLIDLKLNLEGSQWGSWQIFMSEDVNTFTEESSIRVTDTASIKKTIEWDSSNAVLRIDFPENTPANNVTGQIYFTSFGQNVFLTPENIIMQNNIVSCIIDGSKVEIHTEDFGADPFIIVDSLSMFQQARSRILSLMQKIYFAVAAFIGIFVFVQYEHMKILLWWAVDIFHNLGLIGELAVSDFKSRFASSYLGMVWAFVQPVVTVIIYVVVFGYGFKATPVNDFPYVLWLTTGMVPWLYFSDALQSASNSMREYSYLVKKVVFEVKVLPLVKIAAAFYIHLFFIAIVIIMYLVNGYMPTIYYLQIPYYIFCTTMLAMGLSYFISALTVFVPDLVQVINIVLQFGMWATPIMWNLEIFGQIAIKIERFNPMYYIVQGYRDCFFNQTAFWEKPGLTVYFWSFTVACLILGMYTFRKLEGHFADVM